MLGHVQRRATGRTPSPSALARMILGTFDSTILHRLLTEPVLGPKTTLLKGINYKAIGSPSGNGHDQGFHGRYSGFDSIEGPSGSFGGKVRGGVGAKASRPVSSNPPARVAACSVKPSSEAHSGFAAGRAPWRSSCHHPDRSARGASGSPRQCAAAARTFAASLRASELGVGLRTGEARARTARRSARSARPQGAP